LRRGTALFLTLLLPLPRDGMRRLPGRKAKEGGGR
jgi:hypothetical protein